MMKSDTTLEKQMSKKRSVKVLKDVKNSVELVKSMKVTGILRLWKKFDYPQTIKEIEARIDSKQTFMTSTMITKAMTRLTKSLDIDLNGSASKCYSTKPKRLRP